MFIHNPVRNSRTSRLASFVITDGSRDSETSLAGEGHISFRLANETISLCTCHIHHFRRDDSCALNHGIIRCWLIFNPILIQRRRAWRHPFPSTTCCSCLLVANPSGTSFIHEFIQGSDGVILGLRVNDEKVGFDANVRAGQHAEALGLGESCLSWKIPQYIRVK